MPDRRTRSYPPVGAPDRLDQIVRRGRSLRRRRQAGMAAAGTGGTLAVAALVLSAVAVFGGGDPDGGVIADESAPTVVTTTTVPEDPDEMTVQIVAGPPVRVVTVDPAQPVGKGTRQCLEVMAYPAESSTEAMATYEGWDCRPGTGSGAVDIPLRQTAPADGGVQIDPEVEPGTSVGGCAQAVDRPNADALASTDVEEGARSSRSAGCRPASTGSR